MYFWPLVLKVYLHNRENEMTYKFYATCNATYNYTVLCIVGLYNIIQQIFF